ncbi:MAG: hypothetical protein MZV70_19645 [Desulfobacterales bacterium]|nr:hypothetical protein [Desulfobacterales bacterium]
MNAAKPVLAAPGAGARRQTDDGPPPRGHVELLGADVPRPQPVVRPFHGEREPFHVLPARGLPGDVVPQEHRAGTVGQDIDLDDPVARLGGQDQIPDDPRARGLHGRDDRVRQFSRGQGWTAPVIERPSARSDRQSSSRASASFQSVIWPARSTTATPRSSEPITSRRESSRSARPEVGAVGPATEAQRDRRRRQDAPRATGDRGDDRHGDGRADEVARAAAQRARHPPAALRLPRQERGDQRRPTRS